MFLAEIELEPQLQQLILDANLRNVAILDTLLADLQEHYLLTETQLEDMWFVLNEAVTNAIRHGNKNDASKRVRIDVQIKEERYLSFQIEDEGEGFDPHVLPDPTSPERIEEPNGRGVYLICRIADRVSYSPKGNLVEIGFDLFKN